MNPGDQIIILVNGYPVDTIIDQHGVQRFIENGVIAWLLESGPLDLNAMRLAYYEDKFSLNDYMEFYMGIGYSVCGFLEVFGEGSGIADHCGAPVDILNPVWEREVETIH